MSTRSAQAHGKKMIIDYIVVLRVTFQPMHRPLAVLEYDLCQAVPEGKMGIGVRFGYNWIQTWCF